MTTTKYEIEIKKLTANSQVSWSWNMLLVPNKDL